MTRIPAGAGWPETAAVGPVASEAHSPAVKIAAAPANSSRARGDVPVIRDSSSRSPVIVSTRKPASQGTNREMSQPASHSVAAITQHSAAAASTALCRDGWMRCTAP